MEIEDELEGTSITLLDDSRDLIELFPDVEAPKENNNGHNINILNEDEPLTIVVPEEYNSPLKDNNKPSTVMSSPPSGGSASSLARLLANQNNNSNNNSRSNSSTKNYNNIKNTNESESDLMSRITSLEHDNITLVDELDLKVKELNDSIALIRDLETKLEISQEENKTLARKFKESEIELQRSEQSKQMIIGKASKIDSLEEDKSSLIASSSSMKQELDSMKKELEMSKESYSEISRELNKAKHDYGMLNAELVSLRNNKNNNESNSNSNSNSSINEQYQLEIKRRDDVNFELNQKISQLEQELQFAHVQTNQQKQSSDSQSQSMTMMQSRLDLQENNNERLKNRIAFLEEENENLVRNANKLSYGNNANGNSNSNGNVIMDANSNHHNTNIDHSQQHIHLQMQKMQEDMNAMEQSLWTAQRDNRSMRMSLNNQTHQQHQHMLASYPPATSAPHPDLGASVPALSAPSVMSDATNQYNTYDFEQGKNSFNYSSNISDSNPNFYKGKVKVTSVASGDTPFKQKQQFRSQHLSSNLSSLLQNGSNYADDNEFGGINGSNDHNQRRSRGTRKSVGPGIHEGNRVPPVPPSTNVDIVEPMAGSSSSSSSSSNSRSRRRMSLGDHNSHSNSSTLASLLGKGESLTTTNTTNTTASYDNYAIDDSVSSSTATMKASKDVNAAHNTSSNSNSNNSNKSNNNNSLSIAQIRATQNLTATSTGSSPFATDDDIGAMASFEELDNRLTSLMSEKSNLDDECNRLHQRGGKTLKERTRLKQVEARLGVIGKEVSGLRKELAMKPA